MKVTNVVIHGINALLVLGLVQLLFALAAPGVDARRRTWAAPSSPSRGRCIRST